MKKVFGITNLLYGIEKMAPGFLKLLPGIEMMGGLIKTAIWHN